MVERPDDLARVGRKGIEKFLLPMDARTARNVAAMMLETVYGVAPELFGELFQ
jgi:hypothetical protein